MKKIVLLIVLNVMIFSAHAQQIINNSCAGVTVTGFCYNSHCAPVSTCGSVTISPGNSTTLFNCSCDVGQYQGYRICCGGAPNICVNVNDGGSVVCTNMPVSNNLGACSETCLVVHIHWESGNLVID